MTVDTRSGVTVETTGGIGSARVGCFAQLETTRASSAAVPKGAERIQGMRQHTKSGTP